MASVRLDETLEAKLKRAARALNVSPSEFIRDALVRRCEEVLVPSLAERLEPAIGVVQTSGGRAGRTGASFRRVLTGKRSG